MPYPITTAFLGAAAVFTSVDAGLAAGTATIGLILQLVIDVFAGRTDAGS